MFGLHFSISPLLTTRRATRIVIGGLILALLLALGSNWIEAARPRPDDGVHQRGLKLPLSFEPNVGQTDSAVRYLAHTAAGALAFAPTDVAISVPQAAPTASLKPGAATRPALGATGEATTIHLRFQAAQATPDLTTGA